MRKTVSILMTLLLLWSLTLPAAAADSATATELRLEKTEGTVTVTNASGKNVTVKDGMRLYSDYTLKTEKSSYAYISLDSGKAVKLDASSEGKVSKSGKKLELKAVSGKLFFNVSVPLDSSESLNIRTSTMVTGVRGTAGYVVVYDSFHSEICLLEGSLNVTSTDPVSGATKTKTITAGQKAFTTSGQTGQGTRVDLQVTQLREDDIPGFVGVEVAKDQTLQNRIAQGSSLSVPKIIGDAEANLKAEQNAAEAKNQRFQQLMKGLFTEKTNPLFTGTSSSSSSGGSSGGTTAPSTSFNLDNPTTDELIAALEQAAASSTAKTVNVANAALTTADAVTVPSGVSLNLNSGAMTVGSGQTLTVDGTMNAAAGTVLTNEGEITVGGTVNASGTLDNYGGIYITSKESLHVAGTMNNYGTVMVGYNGADGLLDITGTMNNSGTVTIASGSELTNSGTVNLTGGTLTNSGTFTNSGSFAVTEADRFYSTGTYTENRTDAVYAMAKAYDSNNGMVSYLGAFSGMTAVDGDVVLLGASSGAAPAAVSGMVTLDLNGRTVTPTGGTLTVADSASLTVLDSSSGASGQISSTGIAVRSNGTFTLQSGTVSGKETGIVCGTGSPVSISGGEVSGGSWGLYCESGSSVSISGGTVTLTAATPTDGLCAVTGEFSYTGGTLRSKTASHFADASVALPDVSESTDSAGYYSVELSSGVRNLTNPSAAALQAALDLGAVTAVKVYVTVDGGVTLDDDVTVPKGKTLNLKSGQLVVVKDYALTVNGTMSVDDGATFENEGTLTVDGTMTVSGALVNYGSMDITSENSLHVAGTLNNYGRVNVGTDGNPGLLDIQSEGILNNCGPLVIADGSSLTNAGELFNTWTITNSGIFSNTGTLTVSSDGTITNGGTFSNAGTLTVTGGTITNDGGTFSNAGTLTVTGGTITNTYSSGTVSNTGTAVLGTESGNDVSFDNQYGEFLNSNSGKFTVMRTATFNTSGNSGESFTNEGTFVNHGSLTGSGTLVNSGSFTNDAKQTGYVSYENSGSFTNSGSITINSYNRLVNNNTLENAGTITVTAGTFTNAGTLTNKATLKFCESNTGSASNSGTLTNQGTLTLNPNSGSPQFSNSGILDNQGTMNVTDYLILNSDPESASIINGVGKTITLSGTAVLQNGTDLSDQQEKASVTNNGTLIVDSSASVQNSTGTFTNNGTYTNAGTFTNSFEFTNSAGATFTNTDSGTFDNNGAYNNNGTFSNSAKTIYLTTSRFYNLGLFEDNVTRDTLWVLEQKTATGEVTNWDTIINWTANRTSFTGDTTVKLFGDAASTYAFPAAVSSGSVTLDLNGRSIQPESNKAVVSLTVGTGAELTVLDSSKGGSGKITSGASTGTVIVDGGTLNLQSGTIANVNSDVFDSETFSVYALVNNRGTVTMTGGTVTGPNGIQNSGGKLTVSGGTIEAKATGGYAINSADGTAEVDQSSVNVKITGECIGLADSSAAGASYLADLPDEESSSSGGNDTPAPAGGASSTDGGDDTGDSTGGESSSGGEGSE